MNEEETIETTPDQEGRLHSEVILANLLQARNLERLESEAMRVLASDPDETTAHYYLTLALIDLKKPGEAKRHLDHLLTVEPDSARAQIAAVYYYGVAENWTLVRRHVAEGLRQNPDLAFFHQYAAFADLRQMKLNDARRNITRARELSPDDANIVNLYLRIHAMEETSADAAVRRLEEYRKALQLEPENAALHQSIGYVYLCDLDDPAEAERYFREALRFDPSCRLYQRDLFEAVAKRSLVYRLFSIPSRAFAWSLDFTREILRRPWRLLFLLIGHQLVLAFFGWLLVSTLLFWPGGKVYEWLLVSEIKNGTDTSLAGMRAWFRFHRSPRWARFAVFLVVNLTLWSGLFVVINVPLLQGYTFGAIATGFNLSCVCVLWTTRRLRAAAAKRKSQRRNGAV